MESPESKANISRRLFLAGTGAAVAGVAVAACGDDDIELQRHDRWQHRQHDGR